MNGEVYKAAPEYDGVSAYAVSSQNDVIIPSGATTIEGTYFWWNDNGFTGHGWLLEYEGPHPFRDNTAQKLYTDEAVTTYFTNHENLDEIFRNWNPNFFDYMDFADHFRENGVASGCATFNMAQ